MLEKKSFTGGLNSDIEDRLIPSTDWKDAWNIHALTTDKNSVGAIEKARGNEFVTGVTVNPTDDAQCIGAYEDKENKKIYYFIYMMDPLGEKHDVINQYDVVTGVTTNLVFDSRNLNFSKDHIITGIVAIDDKYLMWTDDYNEPGFLNLIKARQGLLLQATVQQLRLIPYAPLDPITYTYEKDENYNKNNLRGNLWQFKYRFVYDDDRKSAFSPISKITYPNEFQDQAGYSLSVNSMDIRINNKIAMSIDIPNVGDILKIEIAARANNLADFKIIKTLFTENSGFDSFDIPLSFAGIKKLDWYNDEPLKDIAINESNALFSNVPLKAKALDIVNANRLVIGNIVEGFDNIDINTPRVGALPTEASITSTNIRPTLANPLGIFDDYAVVQSDDDLGATFLYHVILVGEDVYPNQKYTLIVNSESGTSITYNYTTTGSTTRADIINYFSGVISSDFRDSTRSNNYPVLSARVPTAGNVMYKFTSPGSSTGVQETLEGDFISGGTGTFSADLYEYLYLCKSGNSSDDNIATYSLSVSPGELFGSINIPSFKSNAWHKFGIVYYDAAGRASTTQTSDEMKVFSQPWTADSNYGRRDVSIRIAHEPPSWATKYQIVYSGALGYLQDPAEGRGFTQFMVYKDAEQYEDPSYSGDLKRWKVSFQSALWYSLKFPQNPISYSLKKGDRLRLILDDSGIPYSSPLRDFSILDYNTSQLNVEFLIEGDSNQQPKAGMWFEVYTPTNNADSDLFYETGEVFDIIDGHHQGNRSSQSAINPSAVIDLTWGDVFLKNRTMDKTDPTTGTNPGYAVVEDSHFSDYYKSNSYNKGRPNIYSPDSKQLRRETSIRYSQFYVPDTNINGLGMFFDLDFMDYDKVYGSIQKLRNKGKSLVVLQEVKAGRVLVNEQILSDLSTLETVQKSNTVLSDITYYAEDYGIGINPESFAEFGNSMYFTDAYRGAVLRLGLNGITKISDAFMHVFFNNELPKFVNNKLWGVYNERFNSYMLSFSNLGNEDPYTISFHEPSNRWISFYNFGSSASVTHGVNVLTFDNEKGYVSNSSNVDYGSFYGVNYPCSIEIAFNENPSSVKVFKNIEQESNDVWSCYIYNQYDQVSNLIDEDFEKIENVYWASFWRDVNSDGGLISGDELRGNELIIKLSNDSINFVKMLTVGVKYDNSELTNR